MAAGKYIHPQEQLVSPHLLLEQLLKQPVQVQLKEPRTEVKVERINQHTQNQDQLLNITDQFNELDHQVR